MATIIKNVQAEKLILLMFILLFAFLTCPTFKRNPNLRLLLKEEGYSLLNPRWTKSGWIYYIKCNYEEFGNYGPGEVWRVKDDGQSNELVFPESFGIMDISPSETLLVGAHSGLILFNIKTAQTETLTTTSPPNYIGLRFGSSDTFIYYSADDGLHRINVYTKNDTAITSEVIYYFDIYSDSLLYYNQKIVDLSTGTIVYELPELRRGFFIPHYPDSLLMIGEHRGIWIYNIRTDTVADLNAKPYQWSIWADIGNGIDFNPLGQKQIIFSASNSRRGEGPPDPFELWILEEF